MRDKIDKPVTGIELEKEANKYICSWGVKHKEDESKHYEETNRTDLRRQRDRILYTGGFRRLQDKTQVIAATKNGDHRTRLTHSLEVEQIAVSLADALGLNKDLVSAIALGHDIGHTPFGHAVERFLNDKLKHKGGFSHAVQSVRYLREKKVNLCNQVFEGILKHDRDVYAGGYDIGQFDCSEYNPTEPGNLETQVVYWADTLAYLTHDFEDFYRTEIYKNAKEYKKDLEHELKGILANLIPEKTEKIEKDINNFETRDLIRSLLTNLTDNSLININEINNKHNFLNSTLIIEETKSRIKKEILESEEKDKTKRSKEAYEKGLIINFSKDYMMYYKLLRKILNEYYIKSPEVQRSDAKAIKIVEVLYEEFIRNTKILPLNIQEKIEKNQNEERIIADYIASMTDKYAEEVFLNLNAIGNNYNY